MTRDKWEAKRAAERRLQTRPVAVTTHAMLRYHQRYDERASMDVIEERLQRRVRAAEAMVPSRRGYRVTTGDLTLVVKEDDGILVVVSVWGRRKWA